MRILKKIVRWSRRARMWCWRPYYRAYARLKRVNAHPSVLFTGRPLFVCCEGATIILREGVKLFCTPESNPVIGRARLSMYAMCPGARIVLEKNVGASGICLCAATEVIIGEGTMLGADCVITDTDFHLPEPGWTWNNSFKETSKPVRIGRGCFIGTRAIILKGVTLGDGVVVAAGAVVTRDVPTGHLAFGNPVQIRPLSGKWLRPQTTESLQAIHP